MKAGLRFVWFIAGLLSLALGVVGAFLPVLPTVPFLLLAAFFFARSSERVHDWLISHNVFGPPINDWRRNGSIRRPAKILATISIVATLGVSLALGFVAIVIILQAIILSAVLLFIWSRPEV